MFLYENESAQELAASRRPKIWKYVVYNRELCNIMDIIVLLVLPREKNIYMCIYIINSYMSEYIL